MGKRKTTLHEHQSAVDELEFSIDRQIEELGRLLLEKKLANIDELKDTYAKGQASREEMGGFEKQREEMQRALEKRRVLNEEIEALESEEKLSRASYRKLIGSLGSQAYRVYRSGTADKHDFETVFTEIDRIEAEIMAKKRELEETGERREKENILKKISLGTKSALLKAAIGRLEKQREESFPSIGEKLLQSDLVEKLPDEQAQSLTSSLKHLEEQSRERRQKKEKLENEAARLDTKIEKECGGISPEKKIKELDQRILEQQEKVFQQSRELGRSFLLQPSLDLKLPREVQDVLRRIDELKEQKQTHEERVHTLQAELEIEELQDEIRKKEEQVSRLEKRIEEERKQIGELSDELGRDNNRIGELRKIIKSKDATKKPSP